MVTWNRPPESYYQAAIDDEEYRKQRNEFIREQTTTLLEGDEIIKAKYQAIIQLLRDKLKELEEEEKQEIKERHDRFFTLTYEDYRKWKTN